MLDLKNRTRTVDLVPQRTGLPTAPRHSTRNAN